MELKFKLMDKVILSNGQRGVIFRVPEYTIDPTPVVESSPIYGVLYVDKKGFHYGPYDIDENDMTPVISGE